MLIVNWNFPMPETDIVLLIFVPILFQAATPLQICDMYRKVKNCIKKKRNNARLKKSEKTTAKSSPEKEETAPSLGQDSSYKV